MGVHISAAMGKIANVTSKNLKAKPLSNLTMATLGAYMLGGNPASERERYSHEFIVAAVKWPG